MCTIHRYFYVQQRVFQKFLKVKGLEKLIFLWDVGLPKETMRSILNPSLATKNMQRNKGLKHPRNTGYCHFCFVIVSQTVLAMFMKKLTVIPGFLPNQEETLS